MVVGFYQPPETGEHRGPIFKAWIALYVSTLQSRPGSTSGIHPLYQNSRITASQGSQRPERVLGSFTERADV